MKMGCIEVSDGDVRGYWIAEEDVTERGGDDLAPISIRLGGIA